MKFRLLTYNTNYGQAAGKLYLVCREYRPDIICLQEVNTADLSLRNLEKSLTGYKIADYGNAFLKFGQIYGNITLFNQETILFHNSRSINLPRSIWEFFLAIVRVLSGGNNPRTLVKTDFIHKATQVRFVIGNTHLTTYGSNGARIKQIKEALEDINIKKNVSLIVTGDLNYFPYGRKRLEELMTSHGLKEATRNIDYTITYSADGKLEKYNFIQRLAARMINRFYKGQLKIDYVFYKGLQLTDTIRVDIKFSDHYPIISTFEI